mgnify:CR=1 FL=1
MSDALPQRLAVGVAALRDGNAARAVDLLGPVAESEDLAEAEDLRDIRARVCTLYAQALLASGRASEARRPLLAARDLLTALGDEDGLAAVEELQGQIADALSDAFQATARRRTQQALAERSVEDILAEAPADRHTALLVERATAALDVGRPAEAERIARRALPRAEDEGDLRHQVLALLVLARTAEPARAWLEEARRRADDADAFNLLGFVVKTADSLGVTLQTSEAHG